MSASDVPADSAGPSTLPPPALAPESAPLRWPVVPWTPRRLLAALALVAVVFPVAGVVVALLLVAAGLDPDRPGALGLLAIFALLIATATWALRRTLPPGARVAAATLGLAPPPRGWWRRVPLIAVVALGVNALGGLLATLLFSRTSMAAADQATSLGLTGLAGADLRSLVPVLLPVLLLVAVVAPLAEELLCRGVIYGTLRRRWGARPARFGSAAIFAVLHGWPPLWPSMFLVGLVLARAAEESDTLWTPIAVHALHNTVVLSLLAIALSAPPTPLGG